MYDVGVRVRRWEGRLGGALSHKVHGGLARNTRQPASAPGTRYQRPEPGENYVTYGCCALRLNGVRRRIDKEQYKG